MKLKEMVNVAEEKVMRMMRMMIPCPTRAEENRKKPPDGGQRPPPHYHRGMKGAGLALRAADSLSKVGGLASDLVVHTR